MDLAKVSWVICRVAGLDTEALPYKLPRHVTQGKERGLGVCITVTDSAVLLNCIPKMLIFFIWSRKAKEILGKKTFLLDHLFLYFHSKIFYIWLEYDYSWMWLPLGLWQVIFLGSQGRNLAHFCLESKRLRVTQKSDSYSDKVRF